MLKVGDKLPATKLQEFIEVEGNGCSLGPNAFDVAQLTEGKTIAIFGLPGAYTPTCSAKHVPGYVEQAEAFKAAGVDEIWCVSVNDAFVMNQWAKAQELENVKVIPDGSGEFTRRVGMLVRKDNLGFGLRSWRYAAIVKDGVVEAWFEEPGLADNHGEDPYGVSSPENVLGWLEADARSVAA